MAQIDLVLPIALQETPQVPQKPGEPAGTKTENQFAPLLETALAETKPAENSALQTEPGNTEQATAWDLSDAGQENGVDSTISLTGLISDQPPYGVEAQVSSNQGITGQPDITDTGNPQHLQLLLELPAKTEGLLDVPKNTTDINNVSQSIRHEISVHNLNNPSTEIAQNPLNIKDGQAVASMTQFPQGSQPKGFEQPQQPLTLAQVKPSTEPTPQPSLTTDSRLFSDSSTRSALQQLQQVIDSGNEKGIVVIQRTDQQQAQAGLQSRLETPLGALPPRQPESLGQQPATPVLQTTQPQSVELNNYQANTELPKTFSSTNSQQTTAIRQDAQQQYLEARIQNQNSAATGGEQEAGTNNQGGNELTQQASQTTPTPATQSSGDSTGIFSVSGTNPVDQSGPLHGANTPKSVTLPSGTMIQEQEIIDQMVSRFRLANRISSSQINIRLHPAELGEMKVDLTVKEGAVKANVIAQSQFVQEVLEKNIGKLKSILENQGFTVEEISVTSESEFAGDFNLFDQQLNNRDQFSGTTSKKSVPEDPFNFADLTAEYAAESAEGVDLKI